MSLASSQSEASSGGNSGSATSGNGVLQPWVVAVLAVATLGLIFLIIKKRKKGKK